VVTIAALDLRKRPSHRSELGSQLLAGEIAQVIRRTPDGAWWRVAGPDGYRGWARSWGLRALTAGEVASWKRRASVRVAVPYAVVRKRPAGAILLPVYLHSRLAPLGRRGVWRHVELAGGSRGWIENRYLAARGAKPRASGTLIRKLLGVPYLWGGRTTMGLDCSGFVQMVLLERGFEVPRDAHDQWKAAKRLPKGSRPRAGDLAFFGPPKGRVGHVGIMLDQGAYAHARGSVRINSLDQANPLYDKELWNTLRGFGRPSRPA